MLHEWKCNENQFKTIEKKSQRFSAQLVRLWFRSESIRIKFSSFGCNGLNKHFVLYTKYSKTIFITLDDAAPGCRS